MQKADYLLRLMKQRTDALVATDDKLQQFLTWVSEKSLSVQVPYKPAAVRAFYFAVAIARDIGLLDDLDRGRDIAFTFNLDVYLNCDFDITLDFNLSRILARAYPLAYDFDNAIVYDDDGIGHLDADLYHLFSSVFYLGLPLELRQALEQLKAQVHKPRYNIISNIISKMWWQVKGKTWIRRLRSVMIKHRNIGHDWQFSDQQKEVLRQYYDANKLLMDCLNSDCNVTPEVRSHIEETLLLPIAEIEKHR
jgi:predicted NACHT family NTPase